MSTAEEVAEEAALVATEIDQLADGGASGSELIALLPRKVLLTAIWILSRSAVVDAQRVNYMSTPGIGTPEQIAQVQAAADHATAVALVLRAEVDSRD